VAAGEYSIQLGRQDSPLPKPPEPVKNRKGASGTVWVYSAGHSRYQNANPGDINKGDQIVKDGDMTRMPESDIFTTEQDVTDFDNLLAEAKAKNTTPKSFISDRMGDSEGWSVVEHVDIPVDKDKP
jgi:hypothetical protein